LPKTCQIRPWCFSYLVHHLHKLSDSFFAPQWKTCFCILHNICACCWGDSIIFLVTAVLHNRQL
jgi:hypothetical protein